ncbi:MAG: nucleotide exchange factor GrpE, partial [Bacteroidota bacterium]
MSKDKIENPEQEENNLKTEETVNETETNNKQEEDASNPVDENQLKITELEAKLAEEKDRFLRLYSEFDNHKK